MKRDEFFLCEVPGFFSTQNLIKSVCVVYASEPCFELCAVKPKSTNNARNFEPRDSYKKDSLT